MVDGDNDVVMLLVFFVGESLKWPTYTCLIKFTNNMGEFASQLYIQNTLF